MSFTVHETAYNTKSYSGYSIEASNSHSSAELGLGLSFGYVNVKSVSSKTIAFLYPGYIETKIQP